MRGLSSLERVILECVGNSPMSFEEVHYQSGLQENVCFNILQALIIRGLLRQETGKYKISENISPLIMEEINGLDAKKAETLELMEAVLEQSEPRTFRFQKVALDSRDEKIFAAMLSNLDSFLKDAHKKAKGSVVLKDRKVVFWGVGEVNKLLNQIIVGK